MASGNDTRRKNAAGKLIGGHGYSGTISMNYKQILKKSSVKKIRAANRDDMKEQAATDLGLGCKRYSFATGVYLLGCHT